MLKKNEVLYIYDVYIFSFLYAPTIATCILILVPFFLMAFRFFVGYGLELSRIIPLIIYHLKRKYSCKTEAELKAAWAPADLGYATRVPGDMLIITIALCYSVIAPIIIPFGVVYFGLGWLILRNQVMFEFNDFLGSR